jgi:hypothetical protein
VCGGIPHFDYSAFRLRELMNPPFSSSFNFSLNPPYVAYLPRSGMMIWSRQDGFRTVLETPNGVVTQHDGWQGALIAGRKICRCRRRLVAVRKIIVILEQRGGRLTAAECGDAATSQENNLFGHESLGKKNFGQHKCN